MLLNLITVVLPFLQYWQNIYGSQDSKLLLYASHVAHPT